MNAATKVTVVIPTRDRPDTLKVCLQTALNQDYPNLEVLVSDNFGAPATHEVVRAAEDRRVRYVNTGRRLSMAHNFEFALSHVKEGWVCFLGDDDGLLPNCLQRPVELAENAGVLALSSAPCTYRWPSARLASGGILSIPRRRRSWLVNAREIIRRTMDWRFDCVPMPQLYTGGMVHIDLIDRLRGPDGRFFRSQIPDVYSGFAICSGIERFLFLYEPFAILGASSHSNGEALFRLEKTEFLREENIPFHDAFPMPEVGTLAFSLPAIVCESYLQSSHLHGNCAELDREDMLALILAETKVGRDIIFEWGREFARRNGVDFDRAARRARRPHIGRRLAAARGTASRLLARFRIDANMDLRVKDVFEASIVASVALQLRPRSALNIPATVKRVIGAPEKKGGQAPALQSGSLS